MKELHLYWGGLLALVVLFCLSIYLVMCSSNWFVILSILSFIWVVEIAVFTAKWCKTLNIKERIQASNGLNFCVIFFLITGFVNALFSFNPSNQAITTVIGIFCFCCFALSIMFSFIIKHSKNQKDDGNWNEKTNRVLEIQIFQMYIQRGKISLFKTFHNFRRDS